MIIPLRILTIVTFVKYLWDMLHTMVLPAALVLPDALWCSLVLSLVRTTGALSSSMHLNSLLLYA